MAKFVCVGKKAVNVDKITYLKFKSDTGGYVVDIWFSGSDEESPLEFSGNEGYAFLKALGVIQ